MKHHYLGRIRTRIMGLLLRSHAHRKREEDGISGGEEDPTSRESVFSEVTSQRHRRNRDFLRPTKETSSQAGLSGREC